MKNIICDLGNVLFTFSPQDFLSSLFDETTIVSQCMEIYFQGLWNEYDRGYLSVEDMVQKGYQVYPDSLNAFETMMANWFRYVKPMEDNVKAVESLQKKGYDLYILSNIPEDCYQYLCANYDWFSNWKGVFSFQEKHIKPEAVIYQTLLDRFQLQAQESLFVDDKIENIVQAKQLGFQTLHCTDATELPKWLEMRCHETIG